MKRMNYELLEQNVNDQGERYNNWQVTETKFNASATKVHMFKIERFLRGVMWKNGVEAGDCIIETLTDMVVSSDGKKLTSSLRIRHVETQELLWL